MGKWNVIISCQCCDYMSSLLSEDMLGHENRSYRSNQTSPLDGALTLFIYFVWESRWPCSPLRWNLGNYSPWWDSLLIFFFIWQLLNIDRFMCEPQSGFIFVLYDIKHQSEPLHHIFNLFTLTGLVKDIICGWYYSSLIQPQHMQGLCGLLFAQRVMWACRN